MRSREEFTEALHAQGARYWDKHPFQVRLMSGGCTPDEVRAWVGNRWYYQSSLSQKNGAIIGNCPIPAIRARWVSRIAWQEEGGLDDWLALAKAVGLGEGKPARLPHGSAKAVGLQDIPTPLLGVQFAVDGYVNFCKTRPWLEAVAASLTELFAPDHMADRILAWRKHYPWIDDSGYAYFESRIPVVRGDSAYTLNLVLDHCTDEHLQDAAIAALGFKCDVLWAMLDAIEHAGCPR